jgi:hypothetical protein
MHHLLILMVAAIATLGWLATPLRQVRRRFVLTLFGVFIAGMIASPLTHFGAVLARPLSVMLISAFQPSECPAPPAQYSRQATTAQ